MHWRRKWQPTPVFLPGESQGWGGLVGCRMEPDTTEALPQQQHVLRRARCNGLTCVQGQALPHHTSHTVKNVLGSNHTIPSALGDSPQLLSPQGLLTGGPGGPGWPASPFGPVGPWGERKENQPWSLRSDGTCPPGGRERSPGAHGEGRGVDRMCWAPPSRRCENRTPEGEPGGQGPSLGAGSRGLR